MFSKMWSGEPFYQGPPKIVNFNYNTNAYTRIGHIQLQIYVLIEKSFTSTVLLHM
jgi:hypothetical protein